MLKRFKTLAFALILTLALFSTVIADSIQATIDVVFNAVDVNVNNESTNKVTINYDGLTYVSVEDLAEILDLELQWDESNESVNIVKQQNEDIIFYENGDYYKGDIQFDQPHGIGTMYGINGAIYNGEFKFGLLNGLGFITETNGDYVYGEFLAGNIWNGQYKVTYEGQVLYGAIKDGQLVADFNNTNSNQINNRTLYESELAVLTLDYEMTKNSIIKNAKDSINQTREHYNLRGLLTSSICDNAIKEIEQERDQMLESLEAEHNKLLLQLKAKYNITD